MEKGRLEHDLRGAIRRRQMSPRTEETYVQWYRRFVRFQKEVSGAMQHPKELGTAEVTMFLTHLAQNLGLGASSQNQALNAIVFLYKEVLKQPLEDIDAERAKRSKRLPVVLSQEEVAALLRVVEGDVGLVIKLLYGCGLRVAEGLALRVKDVDLLGGKLEVRGGKGDKDRVLTLPRSMIEALKAHKDKVKAVYEADRAVGVPGVFVPDALARKYPRAPVSWEWFWFFPSSRVYEDKIKGLHGRHHLHEIGIGRELARAARLAGIEKRVTAHTLRHSFATHLILRGVDIRSIQDLLGHVDVRTTEIYTQLAKAMRGDIASPLDEL